MSKRRPNEGIKTVIRQQVNCMFGDDHEIIIHTTGECELEKLTCTCYNNKKEVMGLATLGEQEYSTCLQAMDYFKEKFTEPNTPRQWGLPQHPYKNTPLHALQESIRINNSRKAQKRLDIKIEIERAKETESVVARRLRQCLKEVVGILHVNYAITHEDEKYYFNIIKDGSQAWDTNVQAYVINKSNGYHKLAVRENGVWHLLSNYETTILEITGKRKCSFCGVFGTYEHSKTKRHLSKVYKHTFIALQATSAEGLNKVRANRKVYTEWGEENWDEKLYEFNYRRNQKHILGVVLPKAQR